MLRVVVDPNVVVSAAISPAGVTGRLIRLGLAGQALDEMAATPLSISWAVNRVLSRAELYPTDQLLAACERCQIPSLFIHGAEDPRPDEGARLLSQRIPGARFVCIEGAGHLPWVERPTETLNSIRTFLREAL